MCWVFIESGTSKFAALFLAYSCMYDLAGEITGLISLRCESDLTINTCVYWVFIESGTSLLPISWQAVVCMSILARSPG